MEKEDEMIIIVIMTMIWTLFIYQVPDQSGQSLHWSIIITTLLLRNCENHLSSEDIKPHARQCSTNQNFKTFLSVV